MMAEKDWDDVLDTNLKGAFNLTKPVVSVMFRQRSGTILNITFDQRDCRNAGQVNYSSSKAGMIGFTKALAKEIAKANITVNALALGFVETDMTGVLNSRVFKTKALEQIPWADSAMRKKWRKLPSFFFPQSKLHTGQVIQVETVGLI